MMLPYQEFLKRDDFKIRKIRSHKKNGKDKIFCDDIFTFDIETTSAFINEHGNVIRYRPGKTSEYWNSLEPISLCYIWQFSYNDTVYYGRELRDFTKILEHLPKEAKCYIWVHNLSFEMHFLLNILSGVKMFERQPHKPIKLSSEDFPQIEFRCTYMLTRLKLDTWGKQVGVHKKTGDLLYNRIRTPKTELTQKQLDYCEYDCLVVYAGIKWYLRRYKTLDKIPLTQTGTVRRVVKAKLTIHPSYNAWIKKLVPKDAKQYKMLRDMFAGGYTHANRMLAGIVHEGLITHRDYTSHYPTWMIAGKYPMTQWSYTAKHILPDPSTFDDFAYIMILKFRNIKSIKYNTYIQASKCIIEGKCVKDNGRIVEVQGTLQMTMTELDYLTIAEAYKWDDVEVLKLYQSKKEYLPEDLIKYILELYQNKCKYDGVAGMEEIYLQSKQYLNSLFGMMVTALLQSDVIYDEDIRDWHIDVLTEEQVNKKLDELRKPWKGNKKYFLNYSWGVWVTAYARRALWSCLLHGDNDAHVIYMDTDSMFILGDPDFSWYDDYITKKLQACLRHYNIPLDGIVGVKPNGKKKQLGLFTKEPDCEKFITLGAKRYVEQRNGKLYLTVAGINKGAVNCLHGDIENFHADYTYTDEEGNKIFVPATEFDKDHNGVHKLLTTYNLKQPTIKYPDGYVSSYECGVNLRPTGYTMSMNKEYRDLIEYAAIIQQMAKNPLFQNHLRGRWKSDKR